MKIKGCSTCNGTAAFLMSFYDGISFKAVESTGSQPSADINGRRNGCLTAAGWYQLLGKSFVVLSIV
jgi:hypothetical protein